MSCVPYCSNIYMGAHTQHSSLFTEFLPFKKLGRGQGTRDQALFSFLSSFHSLHLQYLTEYTEVQSHPILKPTFMYVEAYEVS